MSDTTDTTSDTTTEDDVEKWTEIYKSEYDGYVYCKVNPSFGRFGGLSQIVAYGYSDFDDNDSCWECIPTETRKAIRESVLKKHGVENESDLLTKDFDYHIEKDETNSDENTTVYNIKNGEK